MSGATAGGIVGGIIGFVASGFNPVGFQIGFMIGSGIGGYVDPMKIQGPRLTDASRQTSMDGVPIAFGYGTFPTAGNVIWSDRLIERKKTSRQGKGGPKVTEYTYTRSYAVGICEGPIDGILMIKRNGKVVYDARTAEDIPIIAAPGGGGLAGPAIRRLIAQLNAQRQGFMGKATIYLGDEEQLPDPTIEAVEGAGNVPAHRGMAYMVVKDEDLTDLQGAIPQYEFVVAKSATAGAVTAPTPEAAVTARFVNAHFPLADEADAYEYQGTWMAGNGDGVQTPVLASIAAVQAYMLGISAETGLAGTNALGSPDNYVGYVGRSGVVGPDTSGNYAYDSIAAQPDVTSLESLTLLYQWVLPTQWLDAAPVDFCPLVATGSDYVGAKNGVVVRRVDSTSSTHYGVINCDTIGETGVVEGIFPLAIRVTRKRATPSSIPDGAVAVPDAPGYYVDASGNFIVPVTYTFQAGAFKFLSLSVIDGSHPSQGYTRFEQGPVVEEGDEDYADEAFWTAAYTAAVTAGTMPAGLSYSATGEGGSGMYPMLSDGAWIAAEDTSALTLGVTTLPSIVADLCSRAGLQPDEYDTTGLTGTVPGYRVATEGGADSMIAPLMGAYFFDAGEWDGKLRFVKRGGAATFTIGADDLAERDGDAITLERVQEAELLRRVTVGYIDPATDYGVTTQKWERRAGTVEAKGEASMEVPVVLSSQAAAQVAEKKGKVAWSETEKALFSLPALRWAKLTPTDVGVITLQDGETMRVRVMSREEDSGALLMEASRDRQAAYTGTATGQVPPPPRITDPPIIGPTLLAVMDLPLLRDTDDDLGVYVAAAGILGAWSGATLEISTDGGATYTEVTELTGGSVIGTTSAALSAWHSAEYPSTQTLSVSLPSAPESITADALVRYGNRAAVQLVTGEWEVLQYQTVTPTGSNGYTLSGLLRGRYNTTPGAIAAGARFVLLDASVRFVKLEEYLIGQSMLVRAVPLGVDPDTITGTAFSVTNPKSQTEWPVHMVRSQRDGAGDMLVTWIGRARLGTDAAPRHSRYFAGYRVSIESAGVTKSYDTTDQAFFYSAAQQVADFGTSTFDYTVTVYPINQLTGVGEAAGPPFDPGTLASWIQIGGAGGWSIADGVVTYDPVAGGAATSELALDVGLPFTADRSPLPRIDASVAVTASGDSLGAVNVRGFDAAGSGTSITGGTRVASGRSTVTGYALTRVTVEGGPSLTAWTDGTNPVSFSDLRYSLT